MAMWLRVLLAVNAKRPTCKVESRTEKAFGCRLTVPLKPTNLLRLSSSSVANP